MEKKELKKKIETTYLDIAIPSNVENLQLPDPTLLQFYKNYDDRIIWIDDEITTMTLEYAKMIMQWNSEDKKNNIPAEERKPIKVIFFSPGGDLEVNNCLVDTIQLSQTKVIGINVGMAALFIWHVMSVLHFQRQNSSSIRELVNLLEHIMM